MKVDIGNLDIVRQGSHFLGSGGGVECVLTKAMLASKLTKKPVHVVQIDCLMDHDVIVPLIILGCPTIEAEKNYNVRHFMQLIERVHERPITAIVPVSIGGGTLFVPFFVAACLDVPVIDGDCLGRCFPSLQMLSTNMADVLPKKAFISNVMGDVFEIECHDFHALERHARRIAVSSGGICTIIPQILTGEEAKRGLIPGTLTQAMTIGKIIQDTQDLECEEACAAIVDYTKGTFVGIGGIMSIDGYTSSLPLPFHKRIVMKNLKEGRTWEVLMANEFDLLLENGEIIAEVPDIISLCDMHTREPLTIRQLHLNRNIAICTMPAPALWYTEKGLALVRTKEHLEGRDAYMQRAHLP